MERIFQKLSDHSLVLSYLKGINNRHQTLPKYINIWNISILLDYYDQCHLNDNFDLKDF